MSDATEPNFKAKLIQVINETDPIIDKLLLKVVASGWSPVIVASYTLIICVLGILIGLKP